jgi:hypothetical protein
MLASALHRDGRRRFPDVASIAFTIIRVFRQVVPLRLSPRIRSPRPRVVPSGPYPAVFVPHAPASSRAP